MLNIIGAAVGSGGPDFNASRGPDVVEQSSYWQESIDKGLALEWITTLREQALGDKYPTKLEVLCELFARLALAVETQVKQKKQFCVIGGDHSAAIGTWSGAAAGLNGPLGLIWIDAHEDAHTFETTSTRNVHGMPLAALLGYGDKSLTDLHSQNTLYAGPKILPQNLCLIGIRSFEAGENALLERLNVKIYDMAAVKERGMSAILQEAREHVSRETMGYGITLDIDGIDPQEAPGVTTDEPDGIQADDLFKALAELYPDPKQIGFEIMEFNPANEIDRKTEKLIYKVLEIIAEGNKITGTVKE